MALGKYESLRYPEDHALGQFQCIFLERQRRVLNLIFPVSLVTVESDRDIVVIDEGDRKDITTAHVSLYTRKMW